MGYCGHASEEVLHQLPHSVQRLHLGVRTDSEWMRVLQFTEARGITVIGEWGRTTDWTVCVMGL